MSDEIAKENTQQATDLIERDLLGENNFWTSLITGLTHDDCKYRTFLSQLKSIKSRYIGKERFGNIVSNSPKHPSPLHSSKPSLPLIVPKESRNAKYSVRTSRTVTKERRCRKSQGTSPLRFYLNHMKELSEKKPRLEGYFKSCSSQKRMRSMNGLATGKIFYYKFE